VGPGILLPRGGAASSKKPRHEGVKGTVGGGDRSVRKTMAVPFLQFPILPGERAIGERQQRGGKQGNLGPGLLGLQHNGPMGKGTVLLWRPVIKVIGPR